MIIGIGTDILQIQRLEAAYERTQGRLAEKILGPDEMVVFRQRLARNHQRGIAFLATRFAAKEAFSKAIGLGMRMPMTWRLLQTLNEPSGKPVTSYLGVLAQFMTEKNWEAQVTVSDEKEMAIAFVIVTQK
ncbi:holo-[acyl-carrier protein] synthase [Polynucleobacter meluiroseus]|uniref:Holo-[acyl-carrier-protein] synthase n=1 Tax=Polynucleobacter meluiroseus TaxID=1938814 RepID=A0A240DYC7_9BURK|nr:holo-ACP synthase [Polynucleobacter meluiroseus]SNX28208.1 holo-[acyl-carrier protein] synthase [Polynucleobacter meluiroseus]